MKENLKNYSKDELSLRVFNECDLYKMRHSKTLPYKLRTNYDYTNKQLDVLKQDLKEDFEEICNYIYDKNIFSYHNFLGNNLTNCDEQTIPIYEQDLYKRIQAIVKDIRVHSQYKLVGLLNGVEITKDGQDKIFDIKIK